LTFGLRRAREPKHPGQRASEITRIHSPFDLVLRLPQFEELGSADRAVLLRRA
jgi:hypothetical protein